MQMLSDGGRMVAFAKSCCIVTSYKSENLQMANPENLIVDPFPLFEVFDARYQGEMYEIGMAPPNNKSLRQGAQAVTDYSDEGFQRRADGLLGGADTLARKKLFAGLADIQLRLQEGDTQAFNMALISDVLR